jgi:DNA-binding transcriptional LysR family regulator
MRTKIAKINVMMLATLEALYLHKSTVLAAEKLGIAQPSVSWYLKQLRTLTGDELFIRTSEGLTPTDFCKNYYHQSKDVLESLELLAAYKKEAFDPHTASAEFYIAIPFVKSRMLLEGLSVNLMKKYPSIQTNIHYLQEAAALGHLESGLLDICVGLAAEKMPKHFASEKVLESEYILICSDKSKFFKIGKVTKQEYVDTPHIKLAGSFEPSIIDIQLKRVGLLQKTLISVPDIASEIALLRETDFLLIIDRDDAHTMMAGQNFRVLETDFRLPQISLHAVWHARRKNDPAHKWLREYLFAHCRAYNEKSRAAAGRKPRKS